jgi:hypothetical protein
VVVVVVVAAPGCSMAGTVFPWDHVLLLLCMYPCTVCWRVSGAWLGASACTRCVLTDALAEFGWLSCRAVDPIVCTRSPCWGWVFLR